MDLSGALAQTQTNLLKSQFDGGFIRLFSGSKPATSDMAETGTLLGIVTVGAVDGAGLHFDASGATLSKSAVEDWYFRALATGTVGYFRLVAPGDDGTADLDALRLSGTVGTAALPADMNWDSTAVVTGLAYSLDSFLYIINPIGDAP